MLTAGELSANGFAWAASALVLALKLAAATSPLYTQLSLSLFDVSAACAVVGTVVSAVFGVLFDAVAGS